MRAHRTNILDRLAGVLWPMLLASFVLLLCLEAASLLWSAPGVMRSANGYEDHLFVIVPFPVSVATVTGMVPVYLFVLFASAIVLSLVWLLKDAKAVLKGASRAVADAADVPEKSQIGLTLQMFSVTLLVSLAWYVLVEFTGASPSVPSFEAMPVWQQSYVFAKASVYEELIARVLFVGIPLMLVGAARRARGWWRLIVGGKGNLEGHDWALVAISGAIFGLAHAPSWDIFKVPPAVVAGLAFGYLFVKKGLGSAIVLHFATDFTSMPEAVFNMRGMGSAIFFMELAFLGLGLYMAMRYVLAVGDATARPEREAAVPGPGTVIREGRFVCMACGGLDARYSEGTLQCMNCGQTYRFI